MSGNMFWDMAIWFFAIAGLMLMLCDTARYFMYKNTMPSQLTVLTTAEAVSKNSRAAISNLINTLYEQNADGTYEIIIIDNAETPELKRDLQKIADATDCVFISDTASVSEYIKQAFQ